MKNALITGASQGIGAECAKKLAKCGYRVFINYNKSEKEAEEISKITGGIAVQCDVSNKKAVCEMISYIDKNYGGVDILINNAGISKIKMLCDTTEEDYNNIFDVNMKSMYLVTHEVIKSMVHKKYGKIVNISSMWGVSGGSMEVCYSASKAAVIGFTKALSKELGPSGINVNCIAPGVIQTKMNDSIDKESMEALIEETPMMRIGKPQDIAEAAAFLVSDNASFITGQVLCVDGGITV